MRTGFLRSSFVSVHIGEVKTLRAGGYTFDIPLDHEYLHFTTRWRAKKIVEQKRILHGEVLLGGVFAVPVGGLYVPRVQRYNSSYMHRKDAMHGRLVAAKRTSKTYAVRFVTDERPSVVWTDEVRWNTKYLTNFVALQKAEVLTLKKAEALLTNTLPGEWRWGS